MSNNPNVLTPQQIIQAFDSAKLSDEQKSAFLKKVKGPQNIDLGTDLKDTGRFYDQYNNEVRYSEARMLDDSYIYRQGPDHQYVRDNKGHRVKRNASDEIHTEKVLANPQAFRSALTYMAEHPPYNQHLIDAMADTSPDNPLIGRFRVSHNVLVNKDTVACYSKAADYQARMDKYNPEQTIKSWEGNTEGIGGMTGFVLGAGAGGIAGSPIGFVGVAVGGLVGGSGGAAIGAGVGYGAGYVGGKVQVLAEPLDAKMHAEWDSLHVDNEFKCPIPTPPKQVPPEKEANSVKKLMNKGAFGH